MTVQGSCYVKCVTLMRHAAGARHCWRSTLPGRGFGRFRAILGTTLVFAVFLGLLGHLGAALASFLGTLLAAAARMLMAFLLAAFGGGPWSKDKTPL